jgi:hypothetical protein
MSAYLPNSERSSTVTPARRPGRQNPSLEHNSNFSTTRALLRKNRCLTLDATFVHVDDMLFEMVGLGRNSDWIREKHHPIRSSVPYSGGLDTARPSKMAEATPNAISTLRHARRNTVCFLILLSPLPR